MCQLVDAPNRNKVLLDLLIAKNPELMADVEVGDNLGNIDHRAITFTVNHRKSGRTFTFDFDKANFTKLRSILHDATWKGILETKNMEEKWECFKNIH